MILTRFNINYCYHLNCNALEAYSEWMSHRDMTKHQQYWLSGFKDEVPILSRQTMLDQILKRQMEQ